MIHLNISVHFWIRNRYHISTRSCSCWEDAFQKAYGSIVSNSGRGSCEKVGRWAVAEGRSLGRTSQFWGSEVLSPEKFFENIGANLCNLVHFRDIRS